MQSNFIFVTVILLTYNSSEYVIETLESIKSQTFKNFEILLADDGSTDNTREICNNFFSENRDHFKNITVLPNEPNIGTSANCNRAVHAAGGEWIKLIAGDDLLHPECLQRLVDEELRTGHQLYCGEFIPFTVHNGIRQDGAPLPTEKQRHFFLKNANGQFRQLLTDSFNMAPAVFLHSDLFKKFGGFDERFRLLEDLPYWIKLTENGVKFHFIPHPVAYYRTEHESAVFSREKFYNQRFMDGLYYFRNEIIYKRVPKSNVVFYQAELMERFNYWMIIKLFGNRRTALSKLASKAVLFPTLKRLKTFFGR